MSDRNDSAAQLGEEVRKWDSGQIDPRGWTDAPERVPKQKESVSITVRVPSRMLEILKEFARREDIGYQVLMKRWLDDRIRVERDKLLEGRKAIQLHRPHVEVLAASWIVPEEHTEQKIERIKL